MNSDADNLSEDAVTSGGCSCLDDRQLLVGIVERDERALAELIHRYAGRIQGLCDSIAQDPMDADSVVSEVFFELWNRPQSYNASRGKLLTYLMTMARSRSIDRCRSSHARQRQQDKFVSQSAMPMKIVETPEAQSIAREKRTAVVNAVELLPYNQQQALRLAFFSGLTHREVAEQLDLPLGTVKTYIRKGLLHLREMLSSVPDCLQQLEAGETP